MLLSIRRAISRALFGFIVIAGANVAHAADGTDLQALPQMPGARDTIVAGTNLIYVSPDSADVTGRTLRALFAAAGWKYFTRPPYDTQIAGAFSNQSFVKGSEAISVYTVAAPARNNQTSVQYSLLPVAEMLPLPADATDIGLDTDRQHLECVSPQKADALFDFYRTELTALGWSRWTPPEASANSGTSKRAHFVKENKNPLFLVLTEKTDGSTAVYLKAVTHADMLAHYNPKKSEDETAEKKTAPPVEAPEKDDVDDAFDALTKDILNQVKKATDQALKGKSPTIALPGDMGGDGKSAAADGDSIKEIAELQGNTAPVPLPSDAEGLYYEGADGRLEFKSNANPASLAVFYRKRMTALGWREQRSMIDKPNMKVLHFDKADEDLSFTIMKKAEKILVMADGSGLKSSSPDGASDTATDQQETQAADVELTLDTDNGSGLPVPNPHSMKSNTRSLFRQEASATVTASIEKVIAFYRAELGKLNWKESEGAEIKPEKAVVKFTAPEGPAVLKVTRAKQDTTIELVLRKSLEAEKSGLMAMPGKTKLLFGNMMDDDSVVTIEGKKIKVSAGIGSKSPDGPTLDLKPGTYTIAIKTKSRPAQTDTFTIGADEIWGVVLGPGGALPLQMY